MRGDLHMVPAGVYDDILPFVVAAGIFLAVYVIYRLAR